MVPAAGLAPKRTAERRTGGVTRNEQETGVNPHGRWERRAGSVKHRGKKPEPGEGGIGGYLSGLSGARPGKPVKPPETGETEIRPPGGLRRRRDHHGIDWFTSCFLSPGVRRLGRSVGYLSGLSGERVATPGA